MVRFYRPSDLEDALAIMKEFRTIPLAGGTDLMVSHRNWSGLSPHFERSVLFIGHLEEIKHVDSDGRILTIGAACTLSSLLENPEIPQILRSVIAQIASPAIRNRGTIGGNICNASPAGDTLPVLYSLDAEVILKKTRGSRSLPIEKFIIGPGETVLNDDEILIGIRVPHESFDVSFYKKVGTRAAYSCSKLSFTGLVKRGGEKITDIRISLGAVAPTIVRSRENEDRICGKRGDEIMRMLPDIIKSYSIIIDPIDDQRSTSCYRREVSLKLLRHFLKNEVIPMLGS